MNSNDLLVPLQKIAPHDLFFPYNLYRYFTLLENLERQKKLFFLNTGPTALSKDLLSRLTYDEISQRDWSGHGAGTFQTRQMKQIMKFVNDEAQEKAVAFINGHRWPRQRDRQILAGFIRRNEGSLHLHIRNVPVMAGAVFLFLSVRTNPHKKKIVAQLLKTLNKPASGRPKPEGPDEPKEKAPPVYWGKTDKGDFRIITVRGAGQTSGAKCRDKKIGDIKKILQEEGFSSEEIDRRMEQREEESQLSLKQKMCQLLQNHLKEQNRYRY